MSNINQRKEYIKNTYSKQWTYKRKQYGVKNFHLELIQKLKNQNKGRILEVGIGDGYPFSSELEKNKFDVYGIDLSPTHVDMVKKTLPNINVKVGDSEDLEFDNNFFDVVFCFRSSWYFPDLIKSISEMLRVVKIDGLVIFDIQNSQNPIHISSVKKRKKSQEENIIKHIILKYVLNVIKIFLRPFKFYYTNWSIFKPIIIEHPSDPNKIVDYLDSKDDITYNVFGVDWINSPSLVKVNDAKDMVLFDRLVFEVFNNSN